MLAMDSLEDSRLDTEFDEMLVEMKPHVLRLPHKSERQRCALWIKKFCEPPPPGYSGRKNRNAYAKMLVHMLRKGLLEGPFTERPQPGPLPSLPSYMNPVPDWVAGELGSEVTGISSIAPIESIDSPPGLYFPRAHRGAPLLEDRFSAGISDPLGPEYTSRKTYYPRERSPSPSRSRSKDRNKHQLPPPEQFDAKDWQNGGTTTFLTTGGTSLFNDDTTSGLIAGNDTTLPRGMGREMELRTKMAEAKFQEERLRLQQKHDTTVQKILDRKNAELEELKRHYRNKTKEQEEIISKLEKKTSSLHKDLTNTRETREQEITDLKRTLEEANTVREQELEKKLSDVHGRFEEEKFSLQKQHTKNIQELLDDTNGRLTKMEGEYSQQMEATTAVIRELENRVQQLGGEAESLAKIRNQLEREKIELEGRGDRLQADLMGQQEKCLVLEKELKRQKEDGETELRTQKNKYEASIEYMKQEHNLATVKAADTITCLEEHLMQIRSVIEVSEHSGARHIRANDKISDNEHQVAHLIQSLDSSEQQHQNEKRDIEQSFQKDKLHLESLHEKKIRNLQQELDQLEQGHQKKVHRLEQVIRDKEEEIRRVTETHKYQSVQSEQALEEFKTQVERNSSKMYTEMKEQMEKVEQDLHRSKQLREKQVKESQRQMEEERYQHQKQLTELKMQLEQERATLLRDFQMEKDLWQGEKDQELDRLKEALAADLTASEGKAREKRNRDCKTISELEQHILTLKEEVLQANSLRKQQLMELGLLREDEKQKMEREHDTQMTRLRSEMEQHRLGQERKHSEDMEAMIEKTNVKLQDIEKEYSSRAAKANDTINDMQKTISDLKNKINRQQEEAEHEVTMTTTRLEEEKRKMKHHHATSVMSLQQEVETQKGRGRQLERQLHLQEQDYEEKMTQIRTQYEERLRGLVPITVRQELEDTISSLRQQINLLQQRLQVLQEDIDQRSCDTKFGLPGSSNLHHIPAHLGGSVNTLGSSIKSNS